MLVQLYRTPDVTNATPDTEVFAISKTRPRDKQCLNPIDTTWYAKGQECLLFIAIETPHTLFPNLVEKSFKRCSSSIPKELEWPLILSDVCAVWNGRCRLHLCWRTMRPQDCLWNETTCLDVDVNCSLATESLKNAHSKHINQSGSVDVYITTSAVIMFAHTLGISSNATPFNFVITRCHCSRAICRRGKRCPLLPK